MKQSLLVSAREHDLANGIQVEHIWIEIARPPCVRHSPALLVPPFQRRRLVARDIVFGGLGHALKRVVQVDLPIVRTKLLQGEQDREHRASEPSATLNDRAGKVAPHAVSDSVDERGESLDAGHRERPDALDYLAVRWRKRFERFRRWAGLGSGSATPTPRFTQV